MLLFCKVVALVGKANQSQPIFTVKARNPKNHKNHKSYLQLQTLFHKTIHGQKNKLGSVDIKLLQRH